MAEPRSIAIVGAGLAGASCALVLAREGRRVTVFDEAGIGRGCSWGNGAQYNAGASFPMAHPGIAWRALRWLVDGDGPVRLSPSELIRLLPWLARFLHTGRKRRWIETYRALHALNEPCASLYRDLLGDAEWNRLFRPNGALHVWRDPRPGALDELTSALRAEKGVAFEALDAGGLRELEPALSPIYRRGLFFAGSGHVTSPLSLVESLMARAVAAGARFLQARVDTIELQQGSVRLRNRGAYRDFDAVVVAAGFASRHIAATLGLPLSLTSERGYHITVPGNSSGITRPVTDAGSAFVATPLEEGLRIVGIADFDSPDAPPDDRQSDKLVACARVMLPVMPIGEVTRWMGIRPSTPDSLPIIGAHARHPGVLFATGHGHMGLSGAPMTAMLVADCLAGRRPRLPLTPYAPR